MFVRVLPSFEITVRIVVSACPLSLLSSLVSIVINLFHAIATASTLGLGLTVKGLRERDSLCRRTSRCTPGMYGLTLSIDAAIRDQLVSALMASILVVPPTFGVGPGL